ncbi:MAG: Ig-like domain repeat protein, partial [Methanobrevibacter sp.]|nr:Ig-like domain repeat protein [Methanobrevibacter sp.]
NVDLNPEFKSPVQVNENVTFKVQLPKDATGTINVITRMVTYSVELVNGSANITVPGYPLAQSYSPSISYSGDDRYNANSTPVNLVVIKVSDYNLTVNVSDINVGQVEVVNITLPADATEDILIYGNFSERTYSQHINDGNVSFNITDLAAGTYNITVLYQGFNKYESKNVTKTFTVSKVNSTIAIELVGRTIVVSLPDDATGNVSISIGDINENVTIVNGKAILDISNVYPDEYGVTASYAGDGKYLENATYKTITLPKVTDYLINVTVSDIIVGENATVIVNLPTDANGYANITVNNTSYNNIEVKNGIAKLNVSKLSVGDYLVKVNFTDNKYALNYNSTTFRVNKIKTILTPVITVEGRNITVVVGITENATGNITIYVDNVPKDCEIIDNKVTLTLNNTMPGDHLIKAYYDGDVNHTSAETSFYAVTVNKISDYDLIIDLTNIITVIENNTITVTFPDEASGRVTFNYNEEFIDTEINTDTHTATVTLPWLKEGQYDVYISYSDALYDYVENSTSFTVVKLNTTIDVEVNNITKELSEIINITLNETATGDLYINVNGTVYHVTLDDGGKANLTLINLADGNYTAVVSYNGDDFFNVNSTTVYFTVSKMPLNITINASNIIVGNVLAIKFNMSREITDLVTVQVGETNYTTFVYKGNGSLDVYNLTVGDYDIIVYYAGSEDYLNVSNKTNISVIGKKASSINVTVADITVGENITVYVNATKGINGPVYVTIGGLAYTRNLVDGEVNFTVSNLTARDYVISAFFMGNDEFDLCNTTSNFTVHKKNPTLDLSVSDIDISQLVNVSVKVPKDATGHVLINI